MDEASDSRRSTDFRGSPAFGSSPDFTDSSGFRGSPGSGGSRGSSRAADAFGAGDGRDRGGFSGGDRSRFTSSERAGWDAPGRGTPQRRPGGRGGIPAPGGSEPLDQRLGRWVSRGRELVDGVSGARPGARPGGRAAPGDSRTGAGGRGFQPARIGRWVEERLDWLLDDDGDDDWREPWQETATPAGRQGRWESAPPRAGSPERDAEPERLQRTQPSQRPFQNRDAQRSTPPAAPAAAAQPSAAGARRRGLEAVSRRSTAPQPAAEPAAADDAWPDEASFSLNRWQRPRPEREPDPLRIQASRRSADPAAAPPPSPASSTVPPIAAPRPSEGTPGFSAAPPAADRRPLPRSSRRR